MCLGPLLNGNSFVPIVPLVANLYIAASSQCAMDLLLNSSGRALDLQVERYELQSCSRHSFSHTFISVLPDPINFSLNYLP